MSQYDINKVDLSEVGSTALKSSGGFIREEFLPALAGAKAARVYRQMADNDATIGAFLFAIEMLVRRAKWTLMEADESTAAQEAKEFVEEVLFHDMSHTFEDLVAEAVTMLVFGYAALEPVWKLRKGPDARDPRHQSKFSDGYVGLRKVSLRAQESVVRWDIDEKGEILGLWQQPDSGAQVYIPMDRLLLFRTKSVKNNPEGRSILRNAYRSWLLKTRIEEIEGIGVERDLAGLPVMRVPGSLMEAHATPAEKMVLGAYRDLVRRIKRDQQEGVVLPDTRDEQGNYMFDLTLLSTGGSRQFNTTEIIDRYDRRIATSVLADFIFLGQSATGSFALSSDKTALFAEALGTVLASIAAPLNNTLIPRLWKVNGFKWETMPTLVPGTVDKPDLDQLGNFISKLAGSGMLLFPDRDLENNLRELASLPPAPEEGEDMREPGCHHRDEDEKKPQAGKKAQGKDEEKAS